MKWFKMTSSKEGQEYRVIFFPASAIGFIGIDENGLNLVFVDGAEGWEGVCRTSDGYSIYYADQFLGPYTELTPAMLKVERR